MFRKKSAIRQYRRPIVCANCRSSKRKCDRRHPCAQCINRGLAASCAFEVPQSILYDSVETPKHVDQLPSVGSSVSAVTHENVATGQLIQLDGEKAPRYSMPGHWLAMLFQTLDLQKEMRRAWAENSDLKRDGEDSHFANVELIERFPPAGTIDMLLCKFYNGIHPHFPIIHINDVSRSFSSVWHDAQVPHLSSLSLLASILACAVFCMTEEESQDLAIDRTFTPSQKGPAFSRSLARTKQISLQYIKLSKDILELNDYTMNVDLDTIRSLLLCQYALTIFHNDGERANPQLWLTINLATSIGLHRDGALYGLSQEMIEQRRAVYSGILVLQGFQILYCGRPFLPLSSKSDQRWPELNLKAGGSPIRHTEYLSHQHKLAYFTLKVFDVIYSISKADYSVVEPLDHDLVTCTQDLLVDDEVLDMNLAPEFGSMQHIRKVHAAIQFKLLRLLIHRPWAARGFRDATFYNSQLASMSSARWILKYCASLERELYPDFVVYQSHLSGILVRAGLHALSMFILNIHMDRSMKHPSCNTQINESDALLFQPSLDRCERLAISMPDHIIRPLQAMKRLGHTFCFIQNQVQYSTESDEPIQQQLEYGTNTQDWNIVPMENLEASQDMFDLGLQDMDDFNLASWQWPPLDPGYEETFAFSDKDNGYKPGRIS